MTLLAILVAMWVPLRPRFPSDTQLDESWKVALNEAIRLGLPFGDGLVFTFGPYASVYTGHFHEATDRLMLLGSGIIAACFAALMLCIAAKRGRIPVMIVALVMLALPRPEKDALLFSYPLLFTVFIYLKYATTPLDQTAAMMRNRTMLAILLVPFGLLPLVKGSALVATAVPLLLSFLLLHHARFRAEAAIVVIVPAVSCIVLWAIAGQPLSEFGHYVVNLMPIVSGYTDAMSTWGPKREHNTYVLASATLLAAILWKRDEAWRNRIFLAVSFGASLFLAFKAGFVRHDGHAFIASTLCAIAAMFASFIRPPAIALILLTAFTCWAVVDAQYFKTSTQQFVSNLVYPFVALREGWYLRANGGSQLTAMALEQRTRLATECPVEKLAGTADIYSFRQACLIYSGNTWSPRPVFQSYSAYTPGLAAMNAEHLLGERAPQHVLFRVEPIDGRLPALEDGPSWPLLLRFYVPRRMDADLVYLERRKDARAPSKVLYGEPTKAKIGQRVALPLHKGPFMAQISLSPTMLGRIASFLFKSPAPSIQVETPTRGLVQFRFVPGMGGAGFVLSPHVSNVRDFVLMHEGNASFFRSNVVTHFTIVAPERTGAFWSDTYTVRFSAVPFDPSETTIANSVFHMPVQPPLLPVIEKACEGNLDVLNNISPVPMDVSTGSVIYLEGWLAASTKTGTLAHEVYVVIKTADGKTSFYRARAKPRPDVANHFAQPNLLNSGFEAYIDLSGSPGKVVLHLAQVTDGMLIHCEPFRTVTVAP